MYLCYYIYCTFEWWLACSDFICHAGLPSWKGPFAPSVAWQRKGMNWTAVFLLQWFGDRVSHRYINMLDKLFRLIAFGWKYLKNYTVFLMLFLTYHMNELVISFKLVTCLKYDNSITVGLKTYHPIWMIVFQWLVHPLLK